MTDRDAGGINVLAAVEPGQSYNKWDESTSQYRLRVIVTVNVKITVVLGLETYTSSRLYATGNERDSANYTWEHHTELRRGSRGIWMQCASLKDRSSSGGRGQ